MTTPTAEGVAVKPTLRLLNDALELAPAPALRVDATKDGWVRHYSAVALAAQAEFMLAVDDDDGSRGERALKLVLLSMLSVSAQAVSVALVEPTDGIAGRLYDLDMSSGSMNGEHAEWLVETLDRLGVNPADVDPAYNASDFSSPSVKTEQPEGETK